MIYFSACIYGREDTVTWMIAKKADPNLLGGTIIAFETLKAKNSFIREF